MRVNCWKPFRRPRQHGVTDAYFVYNVTGGAGERALYSSNDLGAIQEAA